MLPILLAVAAAAAHAQPPDGRGGAGGQGRGFGGPPRDGAAVQPLPTGTASISGTVIVPGTGQPARRARVTLTAAEGGGARSTSTDDEGRFAFTDLAPGRYTLGASKAGHVGVSYGQTQPGRPGTPIQLADGQRFTAALQLPRGGVITGSVADEFGDAAAGTQVRVLRYVTQTGRRTLQQAGAAPTDDRGIYRVFGLQPGEYVVSAVPRNAPPGFDPSRIQAGIEQLRERLSADPAATGDLGSRAAALQALMPAAAPEGASGYAPVYYPGVLNAAQAAPIQLGVGEERTNVDFQLQRLALARLEGTVVNATAPGVQNVQLTLVDAGQTVPGVGNQSTRADPEGRFRFANVPPGNYRLLARAIVSPDGRGAQPPQGRFGRGGGPATAVRLWGAADVSVDGRDLRDIVVALQQGLSVSGRVVFDGAAQPPADLTRLRITLAPADPIPGLSQPAAAVVDAAGRFTIASVLPGTYRITASGAGSAWTLESATIDGQDTLDFPFEVRPGAAGGSAAITFTDRRTELTGTITTARGEPAPGFTLVLYAADERYWGPQSRRIRTTRPATNGQYTFADVPPGEYRLAAIVDVEQGAWFDPLFLHQMDAASLRVALREGDRKVQNLQVDAAGSR